MRLHRGGVGCFFWFLGFRRCHPKNALVELSGDLIHINGLRQTEPAEKFLRADSQKWTSPSSFSCRCADSVRTTSAPGSPKSRFWEIVKALTNLVRQHFHFRDKRGRFGNLCDS